MVHLSGVAPSRPSGSPEMKSKMKTAISELPRNRTAASQPQSTQKHTGTTERLGGRREGAGLLAATGGRAFVLQHHVASVQRAKRQESAIRVSGGRLPPGIVADEAVSPGSQGPLSRTERAPHHHQGACATSRKPQQQCHLGPFMYFQRIRSL